MAVASKTKEPTCCAGAKKKCFRCQLKALSDSHEARRAALSRSLMDALVADEIAEEERQFAILMEGDNS